MFEIIKHEAIQSFDELERQVGPTSYILLSGIKEQKLQEEFMQELEKYILDEYKEEISKKELDYVIQYVPRLAYYWKNLKKEAK